jgi:galactonate dehydratase
MKIARIRTLVVGNPWKNWIYVLIDTDDGLQGISEATGGLMTRPIEAAIEELSPLCLGKDPRKVHLLWDDLYKATFLSENSVNLHALAGIEAACWDILAKSLGVAVHTVLGGQVRDRIRAYANGWYKGERTPESYAEQAKNVVAQGYSALKFDPFGTAYHNMTPEEEREVRSIVEAVREAVGPDVDIMIEGHDRFTVSSAIQIGRWLEPIRPLWFETPVLSTDVEATVAVARAVPVPVATGERFNTLTQFSRLLAHDCIGIVQPETLGLGGIWRTLQVAAIARAHHVELAPHNAESPVKTVIATHIGAVVPNLLIQECFDQFLEPWVYDLLQGIVTVKDGYLEVPEEPGLGIQITEAEAAKHPYGADHFLRLFSPGWESRTGESSPGQAS